MRKFYVSILMLGCVVGNVYSQKNYSDPMKEYTLNPVVVTGTGLHQKLKDTSVPVEVISSQSIKKTGITDFQEVMSMLAPSLTFSPNTAMGSYLTLNGLSNKHVLILINGRKLTGDTAGNIDLSRVDVTRIKRVEVLKGAGSALYGSDAIGGVINIITDQPSDNISVMSNTKLEERGQLTQIGSVELNKGIFQSSTSYTRQQAHGWQLNPLDESGEKTEKQVSEAYYSNVLNQNFRVKATNALTLTVDGGYYNRKNDHAGYKYDLAYESYNLGFGAKYNFNKANYIQLDLYNDNYESNKEYKEDDKRAKQKKDDVVLTKRQHYYSGNLKGVFKTGNLGRGIAGVEYIKDKLNRPDATVNTGVYTAAVYAQEELTLLEKLKLNVGFRFVHHETAGNSFTPKVAAKYSLGDFNIRAQYSSGFRAPGLDELYYFMTKMKTLTDGNADLKPEKSHYGSFNVEYVGKNLTLTATAFINSISDMISSRKTNLSDLTPEKMQELEQRAEKNGIDLAGIKTYKKYENLDQALIKGFELGANSYLGAGFTLGANYSFAYGRGKSYNEQEKVMEWKTIERNVKHSFSLNANYNKIWDKYQLNINLVGRTQSKRHHEVSNKDDSAPGFGLWNLNTKHTFNGLRNFIIEPGLGINNIFNKIDDRPYGSRYATLSPGRTVYASLVLRFRK